jgi:hypothetical protein
MGMYDIVYSRVPLPDCDLPADTEYQTKDFERLLEHYLIDSDGRLLRCRSQAEDPLDPTDAEDIRFHGEVHFGTWQPDDRFYEFLARFSRGTLEWIRRDREAEEARRAWAMKHRS